MGSLRLTKTRTRIITFCKWFLVLLSNLSKQGALGALAYVVNTKIINGLSNEFIDHVIQGQVISTKIVTRLETILW